VTSGSEKEAIIACRMPSYRETVERRPRAGSPYSTGEVGAPLFDEAFAGLECRVVGKMETWSSGAA
jgi:flavin reductase (DIM6/NTAB) family NADH-FMN oxidoreductase RutF